MYRDFSNFVQAAHQSFGEQPSFDKLDYVACRTPKFHGQDAIDVHVELAFFLHGALHCGSGPIGAIPHDSASGQIVSRMCSSDYSHGSSKPFGFLGQMPRVVALALHHAFEGHFLAFVGCWGHTWLDSFCANCRCGSLTGWEGSQVPWHTCSCLTSPKAPLNRIFCEPSFRKVLQAHLRIPTRRNLRLRVCVVPVRGCDSG